MRLVDEIGKTDRVPVIAPGLALPLVHALLYHRPFAVARHEKSVQIQFEAVLDCGAVDLSDKPARFGERRSVESDLVAEFGQLLRRFARMPAATAADVNAKFALQRAKATLQRSDHAGGNAGGMPVHSHHRAK